MSTRKQRMVALKEWLIVNPLYEVQEFEEDPTLKTCCKEHVGLFFKKKKVAIYKITNYGKLYRKCEYPGCSYRIGPLQLP